MTLVPWWCIFLYVTGCHSHIYKYGSPWNGYMFHTYPHPAKKTVIPRDIMVDVINNLGLKLLAIHNEYNENNIAISPYGALSVLIALGEGLEGDAVQEIQQAAHIPNDISIIRVGLRDIHRHLKSYFIPKEGFLAGLTLNHENVTLRPEYEDILKFYGYDTVSFNSALLPEQETTERPQTTSSGLVSTSSEKTTTENVASTEVGKSEPEVETTTKSMRASTVETTTTQVTTTPEAKTTVTIFIPETATTKIATELITTPLEVTTVTSPPSTVTLLPMEPQTVEITTATDTLTTATNVPTTATDVHTTATEMLTTTEEAITTEEVRSTVQMATTEEITSAEQTDFKTELATLASETTQLSTEEEVVSEEATTPTARTTRDVPTTTVISTTELLTTSAKEDVTEETSTEFTANQNLLTTLPLETTTLPTTTFTTTQNILTTLLSLPETTIINTTPSPLESTSSTNEDSSETVLYTLSTTENVSVQTTDFLNSNIYDTASPVFNTNLSTTIPTTESTTINLPTDNTLYPDNNTSFNDYLTTTTDLITDESTESVLNNNSNDNEIDTTDTSVNNAGFGGTFKRETAVGLRNVIELNMRRKGIQHKDSVRGSKRSSRSVVDYLIARYYDDHFIPHHRHRPYVPPERLSFLVYEKYREYDINFMKYDTVLPFYFVPHLNALALSFPLDSSKYYLLLLLPVDETGVDKLICDLRLNGSLKYIISNLRYTHVIATIPSFMLKGYVTLTPSFQKLGVRKVFEPRQADFTPMTSQRQIYVTNIEQAITVTIRNYVDPNTINSRRNLHRYDPVHFKADHPFLYFVIDTDIHVTLMAGKIVNPLNSRIS